MSMKKQLFVSAVCYLDGDEPAPALEARLLRETLADRYAYVEIILICGPREDAWNSCVEIARELPDIRAYMLSGNSGENASLIWGLGMSIGDMVVTSRLLPNFHLGAVALAEASLASSGLACAVRKARRGWISTLSALTTRLLTGVEYDPAATPYWAVSRTLLNQMLNLPAIDSSLTVRLLSLGRPVSRVVTGAPNPHLTALAGAIALAAVMIRVSPLPGRYLVAASLASLAVAAFFYPDSLVGVCILGVLSHLALLAISEARMLARGSSPVILAESQSHSFLRDQDQLNTVVG